MMTNEQLERELRRARRQPIGTDLRDRVLAAAESLSSDGLPDLQTSARARPVSFRFAVVAVGLAAAVATGLWSVRQTPPATSPRVLVHRSTQITTPPGDEVVVFWIDDETSVLVSLGDK
jgi:hypothetical protein